MSVMNKDEKRQLFLAVKDAWPEISANFSEKGVTRSTRANAWQKVFDECKAAGHGWTNGRDSKWLSRNKWPGIVKEVKERADKTRRTGSGGDTKLSDLDELVLDVIGRDSAGVRGLQVPDSGDGASAEESFLAASIVASGSSSSSSTTQPTQQSQTVRNFNPKTQGPSTPLGSQPPLGPYTLPRKKRPLQSTNASFDDDDAEEDFKRKRSEWLDGMLQLNEQQRFINELTIQKLQSELAERQPKAEDTTDTTETTETKEYDLFSTY